MISVTAMALGLGSLVAAGAASAAGPSPYVADGTQQDIKALSPQQIEGYLEGRGMRMALAAELNGYPGPRHVLELADELELSPEQLAQARRLFEDMRRKAIALGEQIIEREAMLDGLFASGTVTEATLADTAEALGRLNGELRAHHLGYHLEMRDLLDPRQIQNYQRLRGYASAMRSGEHSHGHAGHGEQ
jgi:Spy/CpxP family protein refolding chaperone